jgi:hypothetical protein
LDGTAIPAGTSVVFDEAGSGKIRPAKLDEDPFGVISKTAGVILNAADEEWTDKYLRAEDGELIMEDIQTELPDGTINVSRYPKLNPDYDPKAPYVPRALRPEWNVVGLLGKVKVLIEPPQAISSGWKRISADPKSKLYDLYLIK